ncbi:MAG TPA: chemotaxis protein CheW [Burkholderiales bacterium]
MSAAEERIHSLEIPLAESALLVPSAAVAEVANPTELFPLPGAPRWVLGVVGWRSLAVSVISFEALLGGAPSFVTAASKIVIFYPFPGRGRTDFFGVLSAAEPRPQHVSSGSIHEEDPARLPDTPVIAAGVRVRDRTLLIPDFDVLRRTLYPQESAGAR